MNQLQRWLVLNEDLFFLTVGLVIGLAILAIMKMLFWPRSPRLPKSEENHKPYTKEEWESLSPDYEWGSSGNPIVEPSPTDK